MPLSCCPFSYLDYARAWASAAAKALGEMTEEESAEAPYLDYLQAPLQPLMDNLESQTYETFEKVSAPLIRSSVRPNRGPHVARVV